MTGSAMKRCRHWVLGLVVIGALAAPSWAQSETIRSIVRLRVKSDRIGDFTSAAREYGEVLKKAKWDKSITVWQSLSGPTEYVVVAYYDKWAELDTRSTDPKLKEQDADLTRIGARITQCMESRERIIDVINEELSLPRTQEIPKMVRSVRTRVRPEMVSQYEALIKSEIVAAAKKAGMKTLITARARYGAPATEFRTAVGLDNWAELDEPSPIVKAMGEEAYRQFLAKLMPMVLETEWNVYRYMPDLSYIPSAATTSGN